MSELMSVVVAWAYGTLGMSALAASVWMIRRKKRGPRGI